MEGYDPAYQNIETLDIAPRDKLEAAIRYLLADTKKGESEKLFVEIWSLATRDPIGREIFDRMYSHHRANLARLIAAANPALAEKEVHLRAALIAMQIEGLMLLISENKPRHAELEGIEEACVTATMDIALGYWRLSGRVSFSGDNARFLMRKPPRPTEETISHNRNPQLMTPLCGKISGSAKLTAERQRRMLTQ